MAKQDSITFEKGMMPQFDVLSKIPGSYIEAVNMMRDDAGNIQNEIGTSSVFELATGYKIVGVKNIESDIILACTNDTTSALIILDVNDEYTEAVNTPVLGFSKTSRVNMEAKINYKGEKIVYLAGKNIKLRSINLNTIGTVPPNEIDKITSLFLEYSLPKTDLVSVSQGGEVKSGVYQFAARLVSGSNNTTPFGSFTGVIPIGVGNPTGNRKDYDGGTPQTLTSNKIQISVTNIDVAFEYIEICAITYVGEDNVLSAKSLGKVPINNKTEITYVYSGSSSELGTILTGELNLDNTNYESAEYITQKDNSLLLANLEEIEDTTNWQNVANEIKISYTTHEVSAHEVIDVKSNGTSYKTLSEDNRRRHAGDGPWVDEGTVGDFADYKNPNVCAKFMSYKRDEVYSFTFTPIFSSGRRGDAYHIPALNSTSSTMLGFVEVDGLYYSNNFGVLSGQKVRYHKMPSNSIAPFSYIGNDLKEKISILGIVVDIPNTGGWKDKVAGYIIGRENRRGKETVISQGLVKGIYTVNNGYAIIPSSGKMQIRGTDGANRTATTNRHQSIFTYNSPDLVIEDRDFVPHKLKRIANLRATVEFATTHMDVDNRHSVSNLISCMQSFPFTDSVLLDSTVHHIKSESVDPNDNARSGSENVNIENTVFGVKLLGRRFLRTNVLKVKSGSYPVNAEDFKEYWEDYDSNANNEGTVYNMEQSFNLDLYELERINTSYYGNIYNKETLPVKVVIFALGTRDDRTGVTLDPLKPVCFGGDTFISKYAYTFKDTCPFFGGIGDYQDVPKTESTVYFMLESYNNYNYRHYNVAGTAEDIGSVPYYPKHKILTNASKGVNDYPVSYDHPTLYNKQYSAQNTIQPNYTRAIDQEVITRFSNRIAYSSTSVEGEKFDAYRLFLLANYHDIPKQFGNITGLFVQGNDLYSHTTRALWRCFYNSLATQATSEGDIVIGNGGAFPRPSTPIITQDGGYAGCLDISASVGTPMGRYFYDANNSKFYHLSSELQEISNPAIFDLLRKDWNSAQVVLGYDTGRKRVILTGNSKGISYKPELSSFDGLHEYSFDHFISRNVKDYLIKENLVHRFDNAVFGRYFNNTKNSKIVVNSVIHPSISKRYTSAEMVITSKTTSGLNLPFEFLDTLKAYSLERNTGLNNFRVIKNYTEDLELLGNIFVYKANNKFRFGFPPDLVYDINKNVHDITNLVTYSGFTNEDQIFLPDLIDNHLVIELTVDNNNQRFIKINSFIINFEPNIT